MLSKRQASPLLASLLALALGLAASDATAQSSPTSAPVVPAQEEAKPPATTTFVSLTGPSQPEAPPPAAAAPARKLPSQPQLQVQVQPEPEPPGVRDHPVAFRADFKLPFAVASLLVEGDESPAIPFAPVPQLVLGMQIGRVGLGVGLGVTRFGTSQNAPEFTGSSESLTDLLLAPTVTFDAFESKDGKVALYVLGAPIFGIVIESSGESTETNAGSDLGFQFALGASYALHDNFRLGMEVGPVGHFYNTGNGSETTYSTVSLYTALVGTFVYPR